MPTAQEPAVGSLAEAGQQRADETIRIGLIFYSIALLVLAGGFATGSGWATALFPFGYASWGAGFAFIASILAAAALPTLWCAITRDFRALVGGGIDAIVITLPIAVYTFMILGRKSLHMFALSGVATAIVALIIAFRYWNYPFRDTRPTPMLVRISFALFVLVLAIPGARMVAGDRRVLPWYAAEEVSVIYGWAFIGSAVYFIYGLILPKWSNAVGQLLGTLAYDLILIGPIVGMFRQVEPERRDNLIVYTIAIVYSAGVSVFYLFVNPPTRLFGPKRTM